MDIYKLTEQILEITNNSDYGWLDLDSPDSDRIRIAITKALTITDVIVPKGTLCDDCKKVKQDAITLCKECYLND